MLIIAVLLLGVLIGSILTVACGLVIVYFRVPIEQRVTTVIRKVADVAPKRRGFVFPAEDEVQERRREIIEQNDAEGKDTPLTDL